MAPKASQTLNAQTLVGLLCGMMRLDLMSVARVAGVPQKNMLAWIAGKRQALRLTSIVAILHTVGVRIDALRTVLDPTRVHFWDLRLPLLGRTRDRLATLTSLSKMMAGGALTEVRPDKRHWTLRQRLFRRYYLIAGQGQTGLPFKVVICIHTHPLRKVRVTPDVVKGSLWRDDNDHHCLTVRSEAWQAITTQDMTVQEYDRAFENIGLRYNWSDVTLMAREFGVTAEDIAEHIMNSQDNSQGKTVDESVIPVRFLLAPYADAA